MYHCHAGPGMQIRSLKNSKSDSKVDFIRNVNAKMHHTSPLGMYDAFFFMYLHICRLEHGCKITSVKG